MSLLYCGQKFVEESVVRTMGLLREVHEQGEGVSNDGTLDPPTDMGDILLFSFSAMAACNIVLCFNVIGAKIWKEDDCHPTSK